MQSYHIYEEIGRGRGSVVYKGRKKKEISYVAIKSIDKVHKQRVLHEVSVLFSIRHANVLRFINWYETSNHIWIIVEYCTGGDLLSLLRQDRRLPEDSARIFMHDIASGLQYVHSKGFIYADLKPSNVLINEFGVLKLCDFALARGVDRESERKYREGQKGTSQRATRRGSPYYMAPELFRSSGVHSFASDFWAFGCLLYELVVGSPPFYARTIQELVSKILESQLPDPILPTSAASAELADLLARCLQKDPRRRITWPELIGHPWWQQSAPSSMGHTRRFSFPNLSMPAQPMFEDFLAAQAALDASANRLHAATTPQDTSHAPDAPATESDSDEYVSDYDEDEEDLSEEIIDISGGDDVSEPRPGGHLGIMGLHLDVSAVAGTAPATTEKPEEEEEEIYDDDFTIDGDDALEIELLSPEAGTGPPRAIATRVSTPPPNSSTVAVPSPTKDDTRRHQSESPRGYEHDQDSDFDDGVDEMVIEEEDHQEDSIRQSRDQGRGSATVWAEEKPASSGSMSGIQSLSLDTAPANASGTEAEAPCRETVHAHSHRTDHFTEPIMTSPVSSPKNRNSEKSSPRWALTRIKTKSDAAASRNATERAELREKLFVLLIHDPEVVVRPLDGNSTIEKVTTPRFRFDAPASAAAPFRLIPSSAILAMDAAALEAFLSNVYTTLHHSLPERVGASSRSGAPTVAQIRTMLSYFLTICTDAQVANIIVNSSLLYAFVEMVKQARGGTDVPRLALHVLSTLIRYTTFVDPGQADSGIVQTLSEALRHKSVDIRRRAMCALGEMLFYVATQQESEIGTAAMPKTSGDSLSPHRTGASAHESIEVKDGAWHVPPFTLQMILRCLRPAEDPVVKHYACCAIQNICTQCPNFVAHWFVGAQWSLAIYGVFASSKRRALRSCAATTLWSLLLHQRATILPKFIEKVGYATVLGALSDRALDVALSFVNILCLAVYQNVPRLRSSLGRDYEWLSKLMRLLTGVTHGRVRDGRSSGRESPSHSTTSSSFMFPVSARMFRHRTPAVAASASKGKRVLQGKIVLTVALLMSIDYGFLVRICSAFPLFSSIDALNAAVSPADAQMSAAVSSRHRRGVGGASAMTRSSSSAAPANRYLRKCLAVFAQWIPSAFVPLMLGITRHLVAVHGRTHAPAHTARQLTELLALAPLYRHMMSCSAVCAALSEGGYLRHTAVHLWLLSDCRVHVPGLDEYRQIVLHVIEALVARLGTGEVGDGQRSSASGRTSPPQAAVAEDVVMDDLLPALAEVANAREHDIAFSALKCLSDAVFFLLNTSLFADEWGPALDDRPVDDRRGRLDALLVKRVFPLCATLLRTNASTVPVRQYAAKILSSIAAGGGAPLAMEMHRAHVTDAALSILGDASSSVHSTRLMKEIVSLASAASSSSSSSPSSSSSRLGDGRGGGDALTVSYLLRRRIADRIVVALLHATSNALLEFYEPLVAIINHLTSRAVLTSSELRRWARPLVWRRHASGATHAPASPASSVSSHSSAGDADASDWGALPMLVSFVSEDAHAPDGSLRSDACQSLVQLSHVYPVRVGEFLVAGGIQSLADVVAMGGNVAEPIRTVFSNTLRQSPKRSSSPRSLARRGRGMQMRARLRVMVEEIGI